MISSMNQKFPEIKISPMNQICETEINIPEEYFWTKTQTPEFHYWKTISE
jgi:hypothetical protein